MAQRFFFAGAESELRGLSVRARGILREGAVVRSTDLSHQEKVMRSNEGVIPNSDVAIFGRLIRADEGNLSPELARYLLTVGFDSADQARMQDLATRNQAGALSSGEKEELQSYVKAG